ncbi:MAG: S9 family peptidase [Gammaproteobacteria bacterium]
MHAINRLALAAALCLLNAWPIFAAAAEDDERRLTAEVLWQLERFGSPVVSPDGARVIVPVTTYDEESGEADTRLWLLPAGGEGAPRALTTTGATASDPVFSPDGTRLAFVSKRGEDEAGQVYILPMDAPGEASRLTDMATGAGGLRWVGDHIYFISWVWPDRSLEELADAVKAEAEKKVSAYVWNHLPYSQWDHFIDENRERHLYRVPAAGGAVEPVTPGTGRQLSRGEAGRDDYDVSPDGSTVAFVSNTAQGAAYANYDLYMMDLEKREPRNLTADNPAADGSPMYAPDGRTLAYLRQSIPGFYGDQAKLVLLDADGDDPRPVQGAWDRSMSGLVWRPDGSGFYGAIDDEGTRRVYEIPVAGEPRRITESTDFDSLAVARDGTLVARQQSALHPARIVRLDPAGDGATRLERFNDEKLADVAIGTRESVTYTGADGAEIQMWVHYPPGFDRRRKYPLFLLIHGGPHGAVTDNFHYRWNAQTFASWGYVTAWPNFHGSSGFGQDFTDSINPDWMTRPYADVIAAAEWLADQDWIDADRMVAGGGSYGGYLSTILLGRPHPFKTLVIHAAVYDLYAQMSADFAVHGQRFGEYWADPSIYREFSPHYYADRFETPSLIIHGQNDLRVPVGQAFELFRTLQTRGVESRLVYYPDENHWVLKRGNSIHWYGEVRDWIARFAEPGPR